MKKVFFSLLFLLVNSSLWAVKPLEWGIIRKDYIHVNGYTSTKTPIRNMNILDIAVTTNNQLWLLTDKGLFLVKERKDDFILEEPLDTKKIDYTTGNPHIYAKKDGGLFLLTKDRLWTTTDFENWSSEAIKPEAFLEGSGPHLTQASEILSFSNGSFYVSGFYENIPGVLSYDPSDGHSFHFPKEEQMARLKGSAFIDMHRDSNYVLWMRDQSKNGLWKLSVRAPELVADNITSITSDSKGRIYATSNEGIYQVDNTNKLTELFSTATRYIQCDNKDCLWIAPASQNGSILIRYNLETEAVFRLDGDNCPIEGRINKILTDSNNLKYIWTQSGIYILNDSKPKYDGWDIITADFNSQEELDNNYWDVLLNQGNGNYTAFRMDRKVDMINLRDGQWITTKIYDKAAGLFNIGDVFEKNNQIYFGNKFGLYLVGENKIEPVKEWDKKEFSQQINTVITDKNGIIWFGSNKGIAKFENNAYTFFYKKNTPALKNESIQAMCSDSDGNVFAGTSNGLAVWNKTEWSFYDKDNGLSSKKVTAVASNSKGQTFVITTNIVDETNTIDIYENGTLKTETLPQKIGVRSAVIDEQDNLWINGVRALTCRKANGEYVFYNSKNSPLPKDLVIKKMFILGDELRLIIGEPGSQSNAGVSKAQTMPTTGPDKEKLKTFVAPQQVFIYNTKQ